MDSPRCGEQTQASTHCRWLLDECHVRTHQRARDERKERAYLSKNPIAACNERCEDASSGVEKCDCLCGGVRHGIAAPALLETAQSGGATTWR